MNRTSHHVPGPRFDGWVARALLATVLLGLACSGLLRSEIHAHADAGAGHSHQAWSDDDQHHGETVPGEPGSGSPHFHAVVAPVVMQVHVPHLISTAASSPDWFTDDASAVPLSPTHGTPHRPPIA